MDVIDKSISLIIMSALVPTALGAFHDANTTGFTATELGMWALIGILVVVGVLKQVSN